MKKTLATLSILALLMQGAGGLLSSMTFAAPITNADAEQYRCEAGHQNQAGHENHNYCPTTKDQLAEIITGLKDTRGRAGNYNDIDTSKIVDMSYLFKKYKEDSILDKKGYNLHQFNGKIDKWDTSNVTNMEQMFMETEIFNQPIGNRNTHKVTNMASMFSYNPFFNQPIGNRNTSNVTTMRAMFRSATAFNQPIDKRNTNNVTDINGMFYDAKLFNQHLSGRNTSNMIDMGSVFNGAETFDQDISHFDIDNVQKYSGGRTSMFGFLYEGKLSASNYDKLLISMYDQQPITHTGITFDGGYSTYCSQEAEQARQKLIDEYQRTITDGGKNCPEKTTNFKDKAGTVIKAETGEQYAECVNEITENSVIYTKIAEVTDDEKYTKTCTYKEKDTTSPSTPTCTTTPNPAKNSIAITTTCTGVEPGATLTIPNMACQPTPAGDDGIVTCTGTVGTEPGQVTTPDDRVTVTDPSGNTNTGATTALVIDNTPPVITLSGSETMTLVDRETYTEPGATCTDNIDTACAVAITGSVEEGKIGEYTITYTATDRAGNTSTVTRTVKVVNDTQPHRMGHGQTRCHDGKVEMLMTDSNRFSPSAGKSKRQDMGDGACSSPVASPDVASTHVATPVAIDVTANDTDADDVINTGSVVIDRQPAHGSVTVTSGGMVIYTPNDGYVGEDTFTYTIRDTDSRAALPFGFVSEPAEVKITIDRFKGSATFTGSDTFTPQCATGRSASDLTLTHTETAVNVTGSTLTEAQQNAENFAEELVNQYLASSARKTAGQKQANDTCVQVVFTGSATATGSQAFFSTTCPVGSEPVSTLYEANETRTVTGITQIEAAQKAKELAKKAVADDIKNNGQKYADTYGDCIPKNISTPPIPTLPHTGAEW